MSRWTPRHSIYLSMLLDDVIGTQEIIEIRKDLCKIKDCDISVAYACKHYFTGSKAEGLDLPGSDQDFMLDINYKFCKKLEVVEHEPSIKESCKKHLFVMVTDNVHPGFTMLRNTSPTGYGLLLDSFQDVNGSHFLSSYLVVRNLLSRHECRNIKIQGPSLEHTAEDLDMVSSIHCSFWPSSASEWVRRTRSNGWPCIYLINKIVDFGFHLVPIGYPCSSTNLMEWRISFSIAERYLVWSFNHTQMQMYAILKLIQKEFIKVNCSTENYVLCSYFIKTFLFWKFEETDYHFWRPENFRDCLIYLLTEFCTTIKLGTLKHYFIPSFNLLEVKLTRHAQIELLQLLDSVIQYDINIIGQCQTLKQVWREFANRLKDSVISQSCVSLNNNALKDLSIKYFSKNIEFIMGVITGVNSYVVTYVTKTQNNIALEGFIEPLASYPDQANADFVTLFVKTFCLYYIERRNKRFLESNKSLYSLIRLYDTCSPDIATGKLLCAILFLTKGDYSTALLTINKLLSSIPPYAFYKFCGSTVDTNAKILYADMFINSKLSVSQIAKRAWLFDFDLSKHAIPIDPNSPELLRDDDGDSIQLSPFTLAYYLQFLCYHGLRQYHNRDRALRQLVDVVENSEQCGCNCIRSREYQLAGNCCLFVGELARAIEMFDKCLDMLESEMKRPVKK